MTNRQRMNIISSDWKIQSGANIYAAGQQISGLKYDDTDWLQCSVPRTVLAAQIDNNLIKKDPFFGTNFMSIPGVNYPIGEKSGNVEIQKDGPYGVPWWYRVVFDVPDLLHNEHLLIHFDGINYRANIWFNGNMVADSREVCGTFRRYEFEVTKFALLGKNVLAVEVSGPLITDLGLSWADWNPTPPDKNMGIWQQVYYTISGPVKIKYPFVNSTISYDANRMAKLSVGVLLENLTDEKVTGNLKGIIVGSDKEIDFNQEIVLEPGEEKQVTFDTSDYKQLIINNPRLWWPYQLGDPYLYKLKLCFECPNNTVSDNYDTDFGIVQVTSYIGKEDNLTLLINGKKVLIRGAGYAPDMFLRINESRREAEFRYVKEMGLNAIRLEGKLEDDSFFALADRYGILIIAGWACCDAWEKWNEWEEKNSVISKKSLKDQLLRLRIHPSVILWMNGSDNPPTPEYESAYLNIEEQVLWNRPVISSASAKISKITGRTGVKMSGPYDYVPPVYWYDAKELGGAKGFNTETSPGPAIPPLEELKTFIPEDKLWPVNDVWNFHAGSGSFKDIFRFINAMENRYGKAKDVRDFTWKAQIMAYEGERAMFEAYGANKYSSTGVIQWMLNNAWPGIIWHLFSYYLQPAGGYFGVKKALEQVHAQYSYDTHEIVVLNQMQERVSNISLRVKVYNFSLSEIYHSVKQLDLSPDSATKAMQIPKTLKVTPVYFIKLELLNKQSDVIADNFYWLSNKDDILDYSRTVFLDQPQHGKPVITLNTPQTQFGDYSMINQLPKAIVKTNFVVSRNSNESKATVIIENYGECLAFMLKLRILRKSDSTEVLPIYWNENYLYLLPGESKVVSAVSSVEKQDKFLLCVEGFNYEETIVEESDL